MRAFLFNQKMSFHLRSICFFFLVSSFLNTFVSPTQHLCNPDQRDALIAFKTEFEIQQPTWDYPSLDFIPENSSYPKTESWVNNSDCCYWDGITCDTKSGEVVGLNLSDSCLHGQLKSDSSLFRLRHLRDLNLAYNNFTASPIPAEFDKLMRLERLNLSKSSFSGQIPNKLLQLTKLVSLDLSSSYSQNSLSIDESFLHLLARNLRNLRDLDMSYSNISSEIPHEFSTMWSLRSLRFEECNLFGEFPSNVLLIPNLQSISLNYNPNLRGNFPVFHRNNSMQILCFSFTSFSGTIPDSISNLKHLTSLTLSYSNFSGKIPSSIGNISHLSYLDLSRNNFIGEMPSSIGNLSHLSYISLSRNNLIGEIPFSIGHLKQLTGFYVSNNKLSGNFPSALLNLTQLRSISLDLNHLTCFLPPNISQLSKLESFFADHNFFFGAIPSSLFTISSLTYIYLDDNQLNEILGIENISLLPNLHDLDISNNKIKGPLFIPSRSIQYYLASENNFTGEIPQSTCGLSSLLVLDLSNNNLHGSIPRCLETSMSSLLDLNLRNNNLNGSLPDIFINAKELITLDVSHNQLEGKLPASLTGCSALEFLNVGSNIINDVFPFQLNSLQKLQVLVLHSNKFQGSLHKADGVWFGFPELKIIDASHNDFLGSLPYDYFMNWTAISVKRDNYTWPEYISGAYGYTSLFLVSKGVSMNMERILKIYTAIDFSGNKLHGKIPKSIGLLKELRILNLSSNTFSGHIPASLANLANLESLDLSQNKISGEIPPALGTLSSLSWINVSHNQLVGPIPQGTQFQRQNCSSYEGNPGLYGPSLKDVCGDNHAPTPEQSQLSESSEEEDEEWFSWIAAGLGLVPGVVLGLTIGYIVDSNKYEWFTKTFGRSKH